MRLLPLFPRSSLCSSSLSVFPFLVAVACLGIGAAPTPAAAQVAISSETDVVHVKIGGLPFTDFILQGGNAMKPYLYPLRSASGLIVTRKFPMETMEGEPKDHPHQRGLWFAHERVNGADFWNNEADYKSTNRGRIVVTKISDVQSGADAGSFHADLEWVDAKGVKLIGESRTTTFRATDKLRIIDLDLTLTAAGSGGDAVTFGDAKDGAFGIRLAAALEEPGTAAKGTENQIPGTGTIVNAEGAEREKQVWGKPSNWVDVSGEMSGEKVGVAVFDHPENARRARWHARGYGLLAANPFGLKVFSGDKTSTLDGSLTLKAGESLRLRYRVVIHPGDAKEAGIAKLWEDYVRK